MTKSLFCIGIIFAAFSVFVGISAADKELGRPGGVRVKVLGKSGKIAIISRGNKTREALVIDFSSLQELDNSGNAIGTSGRKKHSFNTFANQVFTFSPLTNTTIDNVTASSFTFEATIASVGATFKCAVYLFHESGTITWYNDKLDVGDGTVKFNIQVDNWEFCNGDANGCKKGQTQEFGNYLDVEICMKSRKKIAKKGSKQGGKAQAYDLGDSQIHMPSAVKLDNNAFQEMPDGYPKLETQGSKNCVIFRFPKFNSSVLYDPTVTNIQSPPEYEGSAARAFGGLPVLVLAYLIAHWSIN